MFACVCVYNKWNGFKFTAISLAICVCLFVCVIIRLSCAIDWPSEFGVQRVMAPAGWTQHMTQHYRMLPPRWPIYQSDSGPRAAATQPADNHKTRLHGLLSTIRRARACVVAWRLPALHFEASQNREIIITAHARTHTTTHTKMYISRIHNGYIYIYIKYRLWSKMGRDERNWIAKVLHLSLQEDFKVVANLQRIGTEKQLNEKKTKYIIDGQTQVKSCAKCKCKRDTRSLLNRTDQTNERKTKSV